MCKQNKGFFEKFVYAHPVEISDDASISYFTFGLCCGLDVWTKKSNGETVFGISSDSKRTAVNDFNKQLTYTLLFDGKYRRLKMTGRLQNWKKMIANGR